MRRLAFLLTLCLLIGLCVGLFYKLPPIEPVEAREMVMEEGMIIQAETKQGTIKIEAGKDLQRFYHWEGATRSVTLIARSKEWYKEKVLGAYYPGPGEHWDEHHGITRACLGEAHIKFASEQAFKAWLNSDDWSYMHIVYTRTGLAVGWYKNLPRKSLNVDVFQVLIDGKIPQNLEGAQDDKITISSRHAVTPQQP